MAPPKSFEELVKQIEAGISTPPEPNPEFDEKDEIIVMDPNTGKLLGVLDIAGLAGGVLPSHKPSASESFAASPDVSSWKIKSANSAAKALIVPAGEADWLVQVYPDDGSVLHFQATTPATKEAYTRWYKIVPSEIYEAVSAAYNSSLQRRKSFYSDSNKQYLICKRVGEADVEIPGYGVVSVPELF